MPVMDEIEFCDLLRRIPDYAACRIIIFTAVMERKFVGQVNAAGATDYVTKPSDVDDLTLRLGLAARSLE